MYLTSPIALVGVTQTAKEGLETQLRTFVLISMGGQFFTKKQVIGMALQPGPNVVARSRRSTELIVQLVLDPNVTAVDAKGARTKVQQAIARNGNAVTVFVDGNAFVLTKCDLGFVSHAAFYGTTFTTTVTTTTTINATAGAGDATTTVDAAANKSEDEWLDSQAKTIIIAISVIIFLIFIVVVTALVWFQYKESVRSQQRQQHPETTTAFAQSFGGPQGHYYPGGGGSVSPFTDVDYNTTSNKKGEFHYYPAQSHAHMARQKSGGSAISDEYVVRSDVLLRPATPVCEGGNTMHGEDLFLI